MNSLLIRPQHFRLAFLFNLPFLFVPILMLISGLLGTYKDQNNNWLIPMFVFGMVYWLPAFLVSLILLVLSRNPSSTSKFFSVLSVAFGLIASIYFVWWLVIGKSI